jgi:hypothetical protein
VTFAGEQNILRLDIAMNNSRGMRYLKGARNLFGDLQYGIHRSLIERQSIPVAEMTALRDWHYKKLLFGRDACFAKRRMINQANNVRVRQALRRLDFVAETLVALGTPHPLERKLPWQLSCRVDSAENATLASLAQSADRLPSTTIECGS